MFFLRTLLTKRDDEHCILYVKKSLKENVIEKSFFSVLESLYLGVCSHDHHRKNITLAYAYFVSSGDLFGLAGETYALYKVIQSLGSRNVVAFTSQQLCSAVDVFTTWASSTHYLQQDST